MLRFKRLFYRLLIACCWRMLFTILKITLKNIYKYAEHILLLMTVLWILMLKSGYLLMNHLAFSRKLRQNWIAKILLDSGYRVFLIY